MFAKGPPRRRSVLTAIASALLATVASACGPSMDPAERTGKQAILDQASLALTREDCAQAIKLLKPVYNSENTDNDVRMLMAAAYGCEASVNTFDLVAALVENSGAIAGAGFWDFVTVQFPSTTDDRKSEGAQLMQDALHTVIEPHAVVLSSSLYNDDTFNPGAMAVQDRRSDANSFLFFGSLAGIGSIQSRYGTPYPSGKRGGALPWTAHTDFKAAGSRTEADGCAYASAIVNFMDGIEGLRAATSGATQATFAALKTTFQTGIDNACKAGCLEGNIVDSTVSCSACPYSLRNRSSCLGTDADVTSWAAYGIVKYLIMDAGGVGIGWNLGP